MIVVEMEYRSQACFLRSFQNAFRTFLFVFQPNSVVLAKDGKQKTLKFSNLLMRNIVVNLKERVVSPIFTISTVKSVRTLSAIFLNLFVALA